MLVLYIIGVWALINLLFILFDIELTDDPNRKFRFAIGVIIYLPLMFASIAVVIIAFIIVIILTAISDLKNR